jgi:hypothetical protein
MSRLFKFHTLDNLYSPPDGNDGGEIKPLSPEQTFELLDTDDDDADDDIKLVDKDDKKEKIDKSLDGKEKKDEKGTKKELEDDEKKDDEEDDEDELDKIEKDLDEDDEPDEDDLELVSPVRRKEILAKYPKIFEDFPYLEKAYYREQKYTEIFPSLDDARAAVEKSQTLDDFEKKILTGDTSTILKTVKEEDEEAFNTLVDNYLPNLQKVDKEAYFHVIGSIIKGTVSNMVRSASTSRDKEAAEALTSAAETLYKYIYGETEWTPHKPLSKSGGKTEDNGESEKLSKERENFNRERFETAKNELNTRIDKTLKKAIEKYIDPKTVMTDFVRKSATRDAYEEVNKLLAKDSRFRAVLDKAWQKAASKGFSTESMDDVRKVINSRAQTVLPAVIKKARIEALRGMGRTVRSEKTDGNDSKGRSTSSTNRGPLRDKSNNRGANNNNGKQEIPKGMSNKDFLMSD